LLLYAPRDLNPEPAD